MWCDIDLDKYIKNINGCTDGMCISVPSHLKVWSFDKIIRDNSSYKTPSSMDCFAVTKNEVLFIEFKNSYNITDEIENEFFLKALDSIMMFRRCLSSIEILGSCKEIKMLFVIDDNPSENSSIVYESRDRIKDKTRAKADKIRVPALTAAMEKGVTSSAGEEHKLHFDNYEVIRKKDFEAIAKKWKFWNPK